MNRQLNVLSGNRLTNGSVLEMHVRYLECILDTDASVLKIESLVPAYKAAVLEMRKIVKARKIFDETSKIQELDFTRDLYWKVLFYALAQLSKLPATDTLCEDAQKAYNALKQYEGLQDLDQTNETRNLEEAINDATQEKVLKSLQNLGLETFLNRLILVNHDYRLLYKSREEERGYRLDEKGTATAPETRQNLKTTLAAIVRRVNAVAEMTDDTDENAQAISDFIIKFNGITEQYRLIIAQLTGSKNRNSSSEDEPAGEDTPSQMPETIE